jgi:hypothetical protein
MFSSAAPRPEGLRREGLRRIAAGIALGLLSSTALATPQLEAVSVSPNPLVLKGAARPEVIIRVTVHRRPFDFSCDAAIDPGDGRPGPADSWSFGDSLTKTTRYEYRKPGKYRLRVAGSGNGACHGGAETVVIVK